MRRLAERWFVGERARALMAGLAAHANLPLERWPTAAIGLMLGIAGHTGGWPVARGGSQRLTDALVAMLRALGGEVETGRVVRTLDELPPARAILLDVTPRQVLQLAGPRLPRGYARRLGRYRPDGADPVAGRCVRPGRHGPPRRDPCRDRRLRGGHRARRRASTAVRPSHPADPLRSYASAPGSAHGLGLLPRAARLTV
jgi:hypothetical protein